ncbi:MAG: hypothetical protein ACR2PL_00615, partial [Dehalococcoidia bacterium]
MTTPPKPLRPSHRSGPDTRRMPADPAIAILKQALLAEGRRSYDDTSVKGGLDRLLTRLIEEQRLPAGSPLARAVRDLSQTGYGTLRPVGRLQWARSLLILVDELERGSAQQPEGSRQSAVGSRTLTSAVSQNGRDLDRKTESSPGALQRALANNAG